MTTLTTLTNPIWRDRETFQRFVDQQTAHMWTMFEELQKPVEVPAVEDEPHLTFEEECAQMTPEQLEAYLDDWQRNLPPEVFDALFARRVRQTEAKIRQLEAEAHAAKERWLRADRTNADALALELQDVCERICELEDLLGWHR